MKKSLLVVALVLSLKIVGTGIADKNGNSGNLYKKSYQKRELTSLEKARLEYKKAMVEKDAAAVKYGDNRHSIPAYRVIQSRAAAAMSKYDLELELEIIRNGE